MREAHLEVLLALTDESQSAQFGASLKELVSKEKSRTAVRRVARIELRP